MAQRVTLHKQVVCYGSVGTRITQNQAVIYNFALVRDLLGDTQEALFLLEGLPMNYRMQDIHAYKIK